MQPDKIDRKNLVVHNKTTTDLRPFHEKIVEAAETGELCEELEGIFRVRRERRGEKVWVAVEFA